MTKAQKWVQDTHGNKVNIKQVGSVEKPTRC